MINSYYIITQQASCYQTVIIRMIPSIPFTHSWSILIISSLSKPRVTKQWSSGWFLLSHLHIHDQFLLYHHSASLVMPNNDPQDDSFYPILTFMINSYYIITQQASYYQTVIIRMIPSIPFTHLRSILIISSLSKPRITKKWSGWFLLSHSHIYDQFLLYHHSASLVLPISDQWSSRMIPSIPFTHSWSILIISSLSKPRVTKKWSSGWFLLSHLHIHDQFLLYHHSASLVIPISDPQDDSFYPILTFMINSYYIITQQASCCQTMILRMIPTIPFSHSWSILIISSLSKPRVMILRMIPSIPFTHLRSILIISSLSKPRVTKQWSSGWFLLSHSHIYDQFLLYHHSASLVLPKSDHKDDSFYPILTFMINSYYIITQQASCYKTVILRMIPSIPFTHLRSILIISSLSKPRVTKQWSSGWFLLSHSHIYDQFLLYHHSASLVLTNSDPQDDSFYPILTFMINSYYIITQQASCYQTVILRMIPSIPFTHLRSILIISSLSKPRITKKWS